MFERTTEIQCLSDLTEEHWSLLNQLEAKNWPDWFKREALGHMAVPMLQAQLRQQLPAMRKSWLLAKMKQLAEFEKEFLQGWLDANKSQLVVGDVAPTRIPGLY